MNFYPHTRPRLPAAPGFRLRHGARGRRGFSFAEVLFAVMILGIGFIMIAAIFPVALLQTKTAIEESVGSTAARGGANYLEEIANNATMPATGGFVVASTFDGIPTPDTIPAPTDLITVSNQLRGNLVLPGDTRYAWVPLYRRSGTPSAALPHPGDWASYAQVFMIPVQARNQSDYRSGSNAVNPATSFNVVPRLVSARFTSDGAGPNLDQRVTFSGLPENLASLVEGAYLIIRSDNATGWMNGRIFRLGVKRDDISEDDWELAPGNGFPHSAGPNGILGNNDDQGDSGPDRVYGKNPVTNINDDIFGLAGADVYVIGRGLADPTQAYDATTNPYVGPAQDVGAYTTFVTIN